MSDSLVQVATAYSVSEALVVQSMLRGYGIEASTFDLGTANVEPGLVLAIGGIRICVNGNDADAARDLIWSGQEERVPTRPYSHHASINAVLAVLLMLLGVPAPARVPLQR